MSGIPKGYVGVKQEGKSASSVSPVVAVVEPHDDVKDAQTLSYRDVTSPINPQDYSLESSKGLLRY